MRMPVLMFCFVLWEQLRHLYLMTRETKRVHIVKAIKNECLVFNQAAVFLTLHVQFLCVCADQLQPERFFFFFWEKRLFKLNLLEVKGWIVFLNLAWTWMLGSSLIAEFVIDVAIRIYICAYTEGFFTQWRDEMSSKDNNVLLNVLLLSIFLVSDPSCFVIGDEL